MPSLPDASGWPTPRRKWCAPTSPAPGTFLRFGAAVCRSRGFLRRLTFPCVARSAASALLVCVCVSAEQAQLPLARCHHPPDHAQGEGKTRIGDGERITGFTLLFGRAASDSSSNGRFHPALSPHCRVQTTVVKGKFVIVDLAGSERVKRSQAAGQAVSLFVPGAAFLCQPRAARVEPASCVHACLPTYLPLAPPIRHPAQLKEAAGINASLLAFGNVVAALASKKGHVPFRDSSLTKGAQFAQQKQSGASRGVPAHARVPRRHSLSTRASQ